jgi:hypothetical protein
MVSSPSSFPPHANVHFQDAVVERLRDVVLSLKYDLLSPVDQLGRCH